MENEMMSLLSDNMIIYTENPIDFYKKKCLD